MKNFLIALCIIFFSTELSAQTKTVTGTVMCDNNPLPGVNVVVKGANKGVLTDFNGHFSINSKKNDKLVFTCLGYKPKEIKQKKIKSTVNLQEDFTICFAKLSDNLPFTIYEFGAENINIQQDLFNTIRAKVPGVQITNTQTNNTPKITMRGDSNTIVIIDGIRYSDTSILQTINPSDIEKVYVANSVAASNYLLTKRN
ncbi:TonB-dependent receptor-like protein [Cellulophaga sp. RHA_52]|uniref:carboxypeptidase-like regulatory domain-containing protein n=1 Tax=Cellulophaga sp. RHA_52 TaxID=1250036 RepID=UPI00119B0EBC|nr:carboxypeptidase-like regulatory domain-containing protein [Cellulophaga sp. RHA_52]TVZ10174.1 TonB-dependent receptor-like protein [Cellulophaga sp. RHA_52]